MTVVRKILFFFILLAFYGTNSIGQNYIVNGHIKELPENSKVYLARAFDRQIDSTIVRNGQFSFKGSINQPVEAAIFVDDLTNFSNKQKRCIFWLEDTLIKMDAIASDLPNARVTQTRTNKDYIQYKNILKDKEFEKYNDTIKMHRVLSYIEQYPASYKSVVELYLYRQMLPFTKVKTLYATFSTQIKTSHFGELLAEFLAAHKDGLKPGDKIPPQFLSFLNEHRKNGALKNPSTRYMLIDFWGSWCAPCIFEQKVLKPVYASFKDKGFEIFGVALDSREKMEEAIKTSNIDWYNVSIGDGYDHPLLYAMGVWAVPQNYLIDENGVIIAINLMERDNKSLSRKLEAIFAN
ncbi:TlpA disulfide reductase family protein [Niabella drilacis]|uniref:Thiol-disulfide isomerase or thioredoxin n=1 Tax=Niabella drilacis (strain DSM 25811 / CCM 8410 / CCUG 62505 / LMG 26954 / E90) TaxID=1285928 RepID=A0A1G6XCX7_NIADE|nr:TlpA disulfide reductase family protein [Niabella drilacis]SDD76018.1 Thiol-disulfide isomerase or thioredoxin [Niabella drilacis]